MEHSSLVSVNSSPLPTFSLGNTIHLKMDPSCSSKAHVFLGLALCAFTMSKKWWPLTKHSHGFFWVRVPIRHSTRQWSGCRYYRGPTQSWWRPGRGFPGSASLKPNTQIWIGQTWPNTTTSICNLNSVVQFQTKYIHSSNVRRQKESAFQFLMGTALFSDIVFMCGCGCVSGRFGVLLGVYHLYWEHFKLNCRLTDWLTVIEFSLVID